MARQEWTAQAAPSEVRRLRHAVCDYALGQGMPAWRRDDVALAVTEIVTNAVLHACPQPGGDGAEIHVSADVRDGEVTVCVTDDGIGLQPRSDSPGAGYGLIITDQLAERVVYDVPDAGGTAVRMTFAAA